MIMYRNGTSSDVIERDINSLLHSSTFKRPSEGEFAKIKELISSDDQIRNHNQQRYDLGGQTESSLMRYRSAPSSFFADLIEDDDFLVPVETSPHEPEEKLFSRHEDQQQKFQSDFIGYLQYSSSSSTPMKPETKETTGIQNVDLPPVSTAMYGGSSQQVSHLPQSNINCSYNHNNLDGSSTFTAMNSANTNLLRQSSSPAGFLSSLKPENGFANLRNVEKTMSSSRLNNHISFTSGHSSSPMFFPQIAENNNEMNDSTFKSLKRTRDEDSNMFSSSIETQNKKSGHYTPGLVHHMSLPKTSSEMAVAEELLRFEQELVPCKTRAKRGCATHPRSIAERVRRTRISARMKKLQELFPSMDKQTSTADMLDMAVQHIKDLQKDLQTLKDVRARCTCSSK